MRNRTTFVLQIVLFGRPGAGKTTIANRINENVGQKRRLICLDLDVCIPQWMKDNFAKGIYPSLEQRQKFALDCCDYVESEVSVEKKLQQTDHVAEGSTTVFVVTFSFVNDDLRNTYRSRFPDAVWILVDTPELEATNRINQRENHFYKVTGATESEMTEEEQLGKKDPDNSQWHFDPVAFPHVVLDGNDTVESNANQVLEVVTREMNR